MDRQSVYIVLTHTGTLFTRVIRTFTGAPYNHASIAFDPELTELYSFGRRNPNNPLTGGFVREDIRSGIYGKFPNTTCVVYELRVSGREAAKMKRVLGLFIRKQNKLRYNLAGVIGIALNRPVETGNAYFCSQFVAELLHRSGVRLWDKPPALVAPDDFRRCGLRPVYMGKLSAYEPGRAGQAAAAVAAAGPERAELPVGLMAGNGTSVG